MLGNSQVRQSHCPAVLSPLLQQHPLVLSLLALWKPVVPSPVVSQLPHPNLFCWPVLGQSRPSLQPQMAHSRWQPLLQRRLRFSSLSFGSIAAQRCGAAPLAMGRQR